MTDEPPESDRRRLDEELELWFAAARADAPVPSDALLARVLADAEALRPHRPAERQPTGGWAEVWRTLGGWPTAAGLAAAGVAGLWIGTAPPDALAPGLEWLAENGAGVGLPGPEAGFAIALEEG